MTPGVIRELAAFAALATASILLLLLFAHRLRRATK
jgi:hypothetical protein